MVHQTQNINAPFKGSISLLLTTLVTFNELCEEIGSLAGSIGVLDFQLSSIVRCPEDNWALNVMLKILIG